MNKEIEVRYKWSKNKLILEAFYKGENYKAKLNIDIKEVKGEQIFKHKTLPIKGIYNDTNTSNNKKVYGKEVVDTYLDFFENLGMDKAFELLGITWEKC